MDSLLELHSFLGFYDAGLDLMQLDGTAAPELPMEKDVIFVCINYSRIGLQRSVHQTNAPANTPANLLFPLDALQLHIENALMPPEQDHPHQARNIVVVMFDHAMQLSLLDVLHVGDLRHMNGWARPNLCALIDLQQYCSRARTPAGLEFIAEALELPLNQRVSVNAAD
ncbi:hypothetical protein KVT40_002901 [Elsinoe batatas]|uniref:Uncharacterized protein n=1 Tax=Elsinoe batatas TaxID=2601811 RepID=A0A8K0L336_9PEZI|nr:hypothetical protein KVT40_002901 [Elsinoe batatas]